MLVDCVFVCYYCYIDIFCGYKIKWIKSFISFFNIVCWKLTTSYTLMHVFNYIFLQFYLHMYFFNFRSSEMGWIVYYWCFNNAAFPEKIKILKYLQSFIVQSIVIKQIFNIFKLKFLCCVMVKCLTKKNFEKFLNGIFYNRWTIWMRICVKLWCCYSIHCLNEVMIQKFRLLQKCTSCTV